MGHGGERVHHTLDSSLWERFGEKLAAPIDKFHSDWKERSTLQNKSRLCCILINAQNNKSKKFFLKRKKQIAVASI